MNRLCRDLRDLIIIDDVIRGLGVFVAYTVSWGSGLISDLSDEIGELLNYLRDRYELDSLRDDPIVRAYRDFFWRVGIDPTKTRPSAEALVRRVLRGKPFPRIIPVVDAGNIASAYTMVPIGIYDMGKAKPPLKLVMSSGGEIFKPIGGMDEVLKSGVPVLKDAEGRVLHIYPHRDCRDTSVSEHTREVLIMGAGVPNVPKALVKRAVRIVNELLSKLGWSNCGEVLIKV